MDSGLTNCSSFVTASSYVDLNGNPHTIRAESTVKQKSGTKDFSREFYQVLEISALAESPKSEILLDWTRSESLRNPLSFVLTDMKKRHRFYKTELCHSWDEFGHCRYGATCQFAHGKSELVDFKRHPKQKSEVCRSYATLGYCYYGARCRFLHKDDSILIPETTSLFRDWNKKAFIRRLPIFIFLSMGQSLENIQSNATQNSSSS